MSSMGNGEPAGVIDLEPVLESIRGNGEPAGVTRNGVWPKWRHRHESKPTVRGLFTKASAATH